MTTDGWEQRLADLGQARELREAIRDTLAGWPLGAGYYQYTVGTDDAREITDALLFGPLAPLLAAQASVERVEALAAGWDAQGLGTRALRRALDGTP